MHQTARLLALQKHTLPFMIWILPHNGVVVVAFLFLFLLFHFDAANVSSFIRSIIIFVFEYGLTIFDLFVMHRRHNRPFQCIVAFIIRTLLS